MPSNPKRQPLPLYAPGTGASLLSLLAFGWLLLGASPADAQAVLERGPGAARIWTSSSSFERVALADFQTTRAVVAAEDGHIVAGEDDRSGDLFFVHHAAGRSNPLPTPRSQVGPLRSSPALLAASGRLEGSVWLEGSNAQDFSIHAAAWNGSGWEDTEIISPQRRGPQLALGAAVLDDGSWIVVWAGFDGRDDDIFWSRRNDGVWSRPRRLHDNNRVPDILPSVVAQGDSAIAAWSFFDGTDYRVHTARWNGSGWSPAEVLTERGAIRTGFEQVGGRTFLTYHSVIPESWNLIEFEGTKASQPKRFALPYAERPLISIDAASGTSLTWPWRRAGAKP